MRRLHVVLFVLYFVCMPFDAFGNCATTDDGCYTVCFFQEGNDIIIDVYENPCGGGDWGGGGGGGGGGGDGLCCLPQTEPCPTNSCSSVSWGNCGVRYTTEGGFPIGCDTQATVIIPVPGGFEYIQGMLCLYPTNADRCSHLGCKGYGGCSHSCYGLFCSAESWAYCYCGGVGLCYCTEGTPCIP